MENRKDTVVIVGGGPVGMWIACQLKLSDQNIKVVVLEKRKEYVREHILKLKIKNMKTPKIKNDEFENLKKKLDGKTPTKTLEYELQAFAEKLKVVVIKGVNVTELNHVYAHVPQNQIIALLGCDGRRSSVRINIMKKHKNGDKLDAFKSLLFPIMFPLNLVNRHWAYNLLNKQAKIDEEQNMIQEEVFLHQLMLKYSIQGEGKSLNKIDYYKTLLLLKYPATEIVGKYQKDLNKTESTCIFILDKDVVNSVKQFTPQNPGKFNSIQGNIKESVNLWMNAKQEQVNQHIIEGSERLVYVPISVYCACDFIDLNNPFPIALVGDAAYGVPYFKALNTSLECGTKITELLVEMFQKQNKNKIAETKFKEYQKYMSNKVYELFSNSRLKTHSFQFGMQAFSMHSKVPWQFIKWSDGEFKKKLYKNFDPHYEENVGYKSIDLNNQKPEDYGMEINEIEEQKQQNYLDQVE